jgi:hypothetical protein
MTTDPYPRQAGTRAPIRRKPEEPGSGHDQQPYLPGSGSGLDGLRRAHAAGVRIGSGSDLLGPLARHKTRELVGEVR